MKFDNIAFRLPEEYLGMRSNDFWLVIDKVKCKYRIRYSASSEFGRISKTQWFYCYMPAEFDPEVVAHDLYFVMRPDFPKVEIQINGKLIQYKPAVDVDPAVMHLAILNVQEEVDEARLAYFEGQRDHVINEQVDVVFAAVEGLLASATPEEVVKAVRAFSERRLARGRHTATIGCDILRRLSQHCEHAPDNVSQRATEHATVLKERNARKLDTIEARSFRS